MALISLRSTRVWRHRNSMAGVSVSACRRPRVECTDPSTPSCPPMAHPTCAVEVVIPRTSISGPPPRGRGPRGGASARGPQPGPIGSISSTRSSSPAPKVSRTSRWSCGRSARDGVAPLDEHHAALVEHLGQAEVERLAELLEAVHVEVVHREPTLVDVHEGEGGARDALLDPEADGRSPARRRSCPRRGRRRGRRRRRRAPWSRTAAASWRVWSTESVVATTGTARALRGQVSPLDPSADGAHHLVGDGVELRGPLVRRDPLVRPGRRGGRLRRRAARSLSGPTSTITWSMVTTPTIGCRCPPISTSWPSSPSRRKTPSA